MLINKRERHFEFNVQAHNEIANLCEDGDFANLGKLYGESSSQRMATTIQLAIIMNRAYEDHRAYDDPSYVKEYLTEEDFRFMPFMDVLQVDKTLSTVMRTGQETEVDAEPPKGKNGEQAKA